MARRQPERLPGEEVARPRAGVPRPEQRVEARRAGRRRVERPDERRVRRRWWSGRSPRSCSPRGRRSPRFSRCVFSAASAPSAVMSGTSRRSSLATARAGSIVLPPGPVYPPTRPSMFTVGRLQSRCSACSQSSSRIHRFAPSELLGLCLAHPRRGALHHLQLRGGERAGLVGETVDGRLGAVGRDQRGQRLHQMERRAVEPGPVGASARPWTGPRPQRAPLATSSSSMTPLAAEADGHLAVRVLRGAGHEDAQRLRQGGGDVRATDHLAEVR